MKYVSFSLWGDKPIYMVGALKNADLCKEVYPDWKMVVFYDSTVPADIIEQLKAKDVLTIDVAEKNTYGFFWRFFALDLEDCEYAIFRDTDSRLSQREKLAVDEWLASGKSLHVMRDHPAHVVPFGCDSPGITGGMWGLKGGLVPITDMIFDFVKDKQGISDFYGIDQTFLKVIYSKFEHDMFIHDEFHHGRPFPTKRVNGRFVGQIIGIDDQPTSNDHLILLYRDS